MASDGIAFKTPPGLNESVVRQISAEKGEPAWMLEKRLYSLNLLKTKRFPSWGPDLSALNLDEITYYVKPGSRKTKNWDEVPLEIRQTFDKLGIPEAERKFLSGAGAQWDSEVLYRNVRKDLEELGVIFTDTDTAVNEYPELVKKYFMTKCVPASDNYFSALHGAVWSGGSFVFVPKNVTVPMPLQIYFLMNYPGYGQFEHTLIIAEEGSSLQYVEGCFTKGTSIKTREGIKLIEEIMAGDEVLTHKSRLKKVYHTQKRPYSGKLYTIRYWGDSTQTIQATEEHPFLAVKRERREYTNAKWPLEWLKACELSKYDYLAIPINRTVQEKNFRVFNVKSFDKISRKFVLKKILLNTDADLFRLIGYYLAEGTTISDHYLSFTFNYKEREYINDVKQLLKKYFGKTPIEYPEYNHGISLILCSTDAARLFIELFGNHAVDKHVPEWVLLESFEKQGELIKGFWRGDGSFLNTRFSSGYKATFRMNTVSRKLVMQLRDMLFRLNIFAGLNRWKKSGNRHDSFVLHVGGAYLKSFSDLVGLNIFYDSGSQLSFEKIVGKVSYGRIKGDYVFLPIRSIEKSRAENLDVYNFSVEGDESYVASGVAVHNCSAPRYDEASVHSAVVEIFAMKGSRVRYTSIQNWSKNVYNLNTKRAIVGENAVMEWVGGTLGSKTTMLYPCSVLAGKNARADHLTISFAGRGQVKDGGAKVIHLAPDTTSNVVAKSICRDGGQANYRGLLKVAKGCTGVKSSVRCDGLLLDKLSRSSTTPVIEIDEPSATVVHEARVGRISDEDLFYLESRGLAEREAMELLVRGFVDPITRQLPLEYAVELNRLIDLEIEGKGAVG